MTASLCEKEPIGPNHMD